MGLARKLRVLLAIPIVFTLLCIFLHLSRQAIFSNLEPRGEGEEGNIVNLTEFHGSRKMQEMARTTSRLMDQMLAEQQNAIVEKLHRRHFSTTNSSSQVPSTSYGSPKAIGRTIESIENGQKIISTTTSNNRLPIKVTVTSRPLKFTSTRRVYDTGWKTMKEKKGIRPTSRYKAIISDHTLPKIKHRYNRNASHNNQIFEFNVVEKTRTSLSSHILMDRRCNGSDNDNTLNSGQSNEEKFACKPYFQQLDVCRISKRYYPIKNTKCKGLCYETSKDRICSIRRVSQKGEIQVIRVDCTMSVCNQRPVAVACIDHEYGIVKKYKHYYDIKSLERGVQKAVSKSVRHDFRFVFLSCTQAANWGNASKVEQILIIPPLLKTVHNDNESTKKDNIAESKEPSVLPPNINVIVLDSISRAHFQRVLPDTANVLNEIHNNSSHGARVLDFQLFQSLAPFTFTNIKSFLTGRQGYASIKERDIGFDVLLKKLNEAGYEATAQEDTCWYDKWGSILTSNRKRDTPIRNLHEKKAEWRKFNQITSGYKISSLGLSHASCFILNKYGKTNMFNEGPSFCYDGKPLSAHLLEYATALHSLQESTAGTKPQFSYTHINIGHETTGKRACVVDKYLRDMVTNLAKLNNTVTILWSDHGPKTTRYAIETMPGKFETYDAFLLLLFPSAVLQVLGEQLTKVILNNQKAVVSSVDLHTTVLLLSNSKTLLKSNQTQELGLFSDKTWRRGCESLPVRDYSLCKCVNYYRFLNLKDRKTFFHVLWMAEFVMGTLNDRLNKQLLQNQEVTYSRNCQWLRGANFRDALYDKTSSRYIFDVLIHSKKPEVFNVQVKKQHGSLSLFHWQRTSIYRDFDICKDDGVALELCICNRRKKQKTNVEYFDIQGVIRSTVFGAESTVNTIFKEDHCLALIERNHEEEVFVFSIANFCERRYRLHIATNGSYSHWRASNAFPMNITAVAYSITFATSAINKHQGARRFKLIINKIN